MYQKNLFGSWYRLWGNAQKTSHNTQTFSKEGGDTFYLIIDLYSDSRQHSLSIKSKEKVCEWLSRVCSCGFFLMESRSQVRCRWGASHYYASRCLPAAGLMGTSDWGDTMVLNLNHTDGIIFSVRHRVRLEEKVQQKDLGAFEVFSLLPEPQRGSLLKKWMLLLELQDMLLHCVTQLHYLLTDECESEQEEMFGKPRLLCHNTMLGMRENSRRIATAAPSAAPTCGFDEGDEVGVWQSPLLNTVVVSKNLLWRLVAPSEKKRWSVFLFLSASSCRVQEIRFYYYLFYEMLRLQLRSLEVKCVWMDKGEFKRDEWCWRKQI